MTAQRNYPLILRFTKTREINRPQKLFFCWKTFDSDFFSLSPFANPQPTMLERKRKANPNLLICREKCPKVIWNEIMHCIWNFSPLSVPFSVCRTKARFFSVVHLNFHLKSGGTLKNSVDFCIKNVLCINVTAAMWIEFRVLFSFLM